MSVIVPGKSNLICRRVELEKVRLVDGHWHNYDHIMIVVKGSVRVRGRRMENEQPVGETRTRTLKAGDDPMLIRHDWYHEVQAEDDSLYFCIYAARDHDGNVVDGWNGNMAAAE